MVRNVGTLLRKKRLEAGYTQEQLALSLGISAKFVSKWERGFCLPPMDKLKKICKLLKIPKEDMVEALMDIQEKRIARLLSNI